MLPYPKYSTRKGKGKVKGNGKRKGKRKGKGVSGIWVWEVPSELGSRVEWIQNQRILNGSSTDHQWIGIERDSESARTDWRTSSASVEVMASLGVWRGEGVCEEGQR